MLLHETFCPGACFYVKHFAQEHVLRETFCLGTCFYVQNLPRNMFLRETFCPVSMFFYLYLKFHSEQRKAYLNSSGNSCGGGKVDLLAEGDAPRPPFFLLCR